MNRTCQGFARFAAGSLLALGFLAVIPSSAAAAMAAEPVLMCDETETRIICCAVDEGKIKSCSQILK